MRAQVCEKKCGRRDSMGLHYLYGNHSSISEDGQIDDYTYQANMSRLKASEYSIGIPHTDPNIELDLISTTSSSGRESREKDVISIA